MGVAPIQPATPWPRECFRDQFDVAFDLALLGETGPGHAEDGVNRDSQGRVAAVVICQTLVRVFREPDVQLSIRIAEDVTAVLHKKGPDHGAS